MAGDPSTLRVSEAEAGFNGDLLWAAVDSVDIVGEIDIFCGRRRWFRALGELSLSANGDKAQFAGWARG
jgi:hypothetical protein